MLCDLTQDGRMHDGLDDALNTAKLIRKLELNPEYQLICRQTLTEEESDPLNICLGEDCILSVPERGLKSSRKEQFQARIQVSEIL